MDHFAYGVILDQNGFADDTKFIFTKNAVVGKNNPHLTMKLCSRQSLLIM